MLTTNRCHRFNTYRHNYLDVAYEHPILFANFGPANNGVNEKSG